MHLWTTKNENKCTSMWKCVLFSAVFALIPSFFFQWNVRNRRREVWNENTAKEGREEAAAVSLSLLLDALLFVATRIQVEGEVGPLVTRGEGDGLTQGEAYGVDDALASRLWGAHADSRGPAGGAHYMRGWGKIHGLSMLHDALPDDVLELRRDLQPGQVLMVITQEGALVFAGGATLLSNPSYDSCWIGKGSPPCYSSQSGRCWLGPVLWSSPSSLRSPAE